MSRLRKTFLAGALLVPLVVGGFVVQERGPREGARLFDQVLTLVADRFVDTVDTATLYEKAARGMVSQLNDPYSELFSPKQLQRFSSQSTGRYGGIGMQIENQEGNITVVKVFPNTPAERAGVQEGDRIVAIDSLSTRGWSTQQVSDTLVGTIGTRVNVRFARPGVTQPIDHRFTRAEVHVPAVQYYVMLDNNIGYISLQTFNETAADELQNAVNALTKRGAKSFVLDLRDNPGGILDQALSISDLFLREGQQIASVRGRHGQNQSYITRRGSHFPNAPMIVMVNGYSASASEIVAGALQDHDRALVVGTTTFGKGLVQTVFPLEGGWALKMTTAKWYTPAGRSIQKDRTPNAPGVVASASSAGDVSRNQSTTGEEQPDSTETEAVKKDRPIFRSDAGRIVYGGGGITPDVIVPEDTASTPEQEFARALAPKAGLVRATLYDMALEMKNKGQVSPSFTITPQIRDDFFRRLQAAKVTSDRAAFDKAHPLVDRWIGDQTLRLAYGDTAAFRRNVTEDPQLARALDMLKRGSTQKDLFALAQAYAKPDQRDQD
ncbi:MAG TPA: S41 family peptidase [Gemmatimonadaceae bacterium]|jgi:carboxyl-terminal processing protease|nr:S41 family peptidase [Gemmatimonadaceae bacterium]